jgi:hypothetical protein
LLAALSTSPLAFAQSGSEKGAAAQMLFDEAMRLMKVGNADQACPKLEESQRLDPGMGTQFRLAECYEKLGRTASAWALFNEVASAAHAGGSAKREAQAQKRADALVPRIARLSIIVPPAVADIDGLTIERDGNIVWRSSWGTLLPVDPGEHVVTATAPHKRFWQSKLSVKEGEKGEMKVPLLEDFRDPEPLTPAPLTPAPPPTTTPAGRSAGPAIALGSLATLGIGAGITFVALRAGKVSDAEDLSGQIKQRGKHCVPGEQGQDTSCGELSSLASNADTFGTFSIVGFAVGSAAAIGTAVYLLWRTAKPAPAAFRVTPVFDVMGGGLIASGSF